MKILQDKATQILNLFYKKRYIFSCKTNEIKTLNNDMYEIKLLNEERHRYYLQSLNKLINPNKVTYRLANKNCLGFIAIHKELNEVIGFYWALVPSSTPLWHDKFKINKEEALLFNAVVDKNYRGKGIYPNLISFAHDFLIKEKIKCIYTIIETRNISSLKANRKCGLEIVGENYLIKFMKKNIFSIIIVGRRRNIYYVYRNEKSNSF